MKNVSAYFKNGKRSDRTRPFYAFVLLIFSLFAAGSPLNAQTDPGNAPAVLFENPLIYLYIIIFVLIGAVVYSVFNAKRVLEQNGKSMDVPVPSFRWMASHGKLVSIIFLLIVLAAIIWAVSY